MESYCPILGHMPTSRPIPVVKRIEFIDLFTSGSHYTREAGGVSQFYLNHID